MMFGLPQHTIDRINAVFAQIPAVEKVVLYGSRAKGNYKTGSDIDITLLGDELNYSHIGMIDSQLDDLLLPYTFDISLFKQISNPDLIDHINRVGVVFYQKGK